MRKNSLLMLWLLVSTVLAGCATRVGGSCKYADIPGTCTVESVTPTGAGTSSCSNDPVEVRFDFSPLDSGAQADYRYPAQSDTDRSLTIAGGALPPRPWIESEGLTEGSQHPCVRREITRGTCTPVIFEFTEIDYAAGIDQCYDA